ncbi:hypothetical protein JCM11251_002272 [Rhodosporidiobolus azoricus]
MNVHDLCDALAEALARSGIDCLPAVTRYLAWHWTFKRWREVVHYVTEDMVGLDDAPGTPEANSDNEDDIIFASPTNSRKKATQSTKGKKRLNPNLIDFTQVTKRRDAEISLFADRLGFEIKDGKINVAKVWREHLNAYFQGIGDLEARIKRRWNRWAGYPKSKENPKSVISYDRLEVVNNRHRKKPWIFSLLVIMAVLQFSPASHYNPQPGEEKMVREMHLHFQYTKVDLRYLQLLGFGTANGMRPQFPEPSRGLFDKKPTADVLKIALDADDLWQKRQFDELLTWGFSKSQRVAILSSYELV